MKLIMKKIFENKKIISSEIVTNKNGLVTSYRICIVNRA